MENFLSKYVDSNWTTIRGETGGSQKPYVLFRDFPGLQSANVIGFNATQWSYPFIDHDEKTGKFAFKDKKFSRLPVEVLFKTNKGSFSVVCLHVKSKFSFQSSNAKSSDPEKRRRGIAEGLEQRARILQEASLLRGHVQAHPFNAEVKGRMLVAGDLNDGPGVDFFEKRFFSTDCLSRLRGDIQHLNRILTNVVERGPMNKRFSAIFFDKLDKVLRKPLLDHLLVTPEFLKNTGLRVLPSTAKIEHTAYLKQNSGDWTKNKKPKRTLYPSDHRPATLTVKF